DGRVLRVHRAGRVRQGRCRRVARRRPRQRRHRARRARDRAVPGAHRGLRAVGQPPPRPGARGASEMRTSGTAIVWFLGFVAITLAITYWAARRTRTSAEFFAAGGKISALQNGFALAGDYMSAGSFLGIAGLVSTSGFDGLIYSVGWLVGWPVVLFLIAEPLRNLGRYTFADVVAARLNPMPVRIAAAGGTLATIA